MPTPPAMRRPTPTLRPPPVPACPRRIVSTRTVAPPTSEKRSHRWYGTASTVISRPTPDFSRPTMRAPRGAVNAEGWYVSRRSSSASSKCARVDAGSLSRISRATSWGERSVSVPGPASSPVDAPLGAPGGAVSRGSAPGLMRTPGSLLPSSKVTVRGAGPGGRTSSPVRRRAGRCRSSWVSSGTGSPRSGVSASSGPVSPAMLRSHSPKGSEPSGCEVSGGTGGATGSGSDSVPGAGSGSDSVSGPGFTPGSLFGPVPVSGSDTGSGATGTSAS